MLSLKLAELKTLLPSKPTVVINKSRCFNSLDCDMDVGMRGILLKLREDSDGCVEMVLDISLFEPFNKTLGKANYWDDHGGPTLTWFESSYYPEDGKTSIYVDSALYESSPFIGLSNAGLIPEFLATNADTQNAGYVCYLEAQLTAARNQLADKK